MEENIVLQLEDLVESTLSYVKKIPSGCIKIADFLREGSKEKAYSSITDFIEGIDWLTESLNILLQYQCVIYIEIEQLNQLLKEINDALQMKNDILLADLFEYEVADFFGNLSEIKINQN